MSHSTIEAIIFDMDGLLLDSEPLWHIAEKNIFNKVGIELTTEMCMQTMGKRVIEVVEYWYTQKPWKGMSVAEVSDQIELEVMELFTTLESPMPGAKETLAFFQAQNIRMAVASSSALRLIEKVISHFNFGGFFELLCSAENESKGKPDPAVYLTAASRMSVNPLKCVAFEDSPNGVRAAHAAGMFTIAVPDKALAKDSAFELADLKLDSLEEFDALLWQKIIQAMS